MRAAWAVLLLWAAPAAAQPVDCGATDLSAADLITCTEAALVEAEAEMDEAYRVALVRAAALDERLTLGQATVSTVFEDTLRASQVAWLAYREAACEAEALSIGGEVLPLVETDCMGRLTLRRTERLQAFGPDE